MVNIQHYSLVRTIYFSHGSSTDYQTRYQVKNIYFCDWKTYLFWFISTLNTRFGHVKDKTWWHHTTIFHKIVDPHFVISELFSLSCGSRRRDPNSSGWKFQLNNLAVKRLNPDLNWTLSMLWMWCQCPFQCVLSESWRPMLLDLGLTVLERSAIILFGV